MDVGSGARRAFPWGPAMSLWAMALVGSLFSECNERHRFCINGDLCISCALVALPFPCFTSAMMCNAFSECIGGIAFFPGVFQCNGEQHISPVNWMVVQFLHFCQCKGGQRIFPVCVHDKNLQGPRLYA